MLTIVALLGPAGVRADSGADGAAIYDALKRDGLLEDYLTDSVATLAGELVRAAGRWSGTAVNQPYRPGLVNIYLVDAARLPERNRYDALDIDLSRGSIRGNAMAHERTGMLIVDTGLLKSLVTVAMLFGERGVSTPTAVAYVRARGVDAFRELWDPAVNAAIENAGYLDKWVLLASGSAAFVLAHEMGHLDIGGRDARARRRPMRFESIEDKDKHWVCDDLVDPRYRAQQDLERRADDFAVEVLSRVVFPEGVVDRRLLRYEIGARWYVVYSLGEQMVESLFATESRNILASLRTLFGPEAFGALMERKQRSGRGSVHVFFPKNHPANIRRASDSLDRLGESPYSLYHGEPPGTAPEMAMFEMLTSRECAELRARYGD